MPKLPRSTSSATISRASGTIPSRPAKPHPDRLKIMHLFPDRPLAVLIVAKPRGGLRYKQEKQCSEYATVLIWAAATQVDPEDFVERVSAIKLKACLREVREKR